MIIEKSEKIYIVVEQKTQWKLTTNNGSVEVEYNVDKGICPTFTDLKHYVDTDSMF